MTSSSHSNPRLPGQSFRSLRLLQSYLLVFHFYHILVLLVIQILLLIEMSLLKIARVACHKCPICTTESQTAICEIDFYF